MLFLSSSCRRWRFESTVEHGRNGARKQKQKCLDTGGAWTAHLVLRHNQGRRTQEATIVAQRTKIQTPLLLNESPGLPYVCRTYNIVYNHNPLFTWRVLRTSPDTQIAWGCCCLLLGTEELKQSLSLIFCSRFPCAFFLPALRCTEVAEICGFGEYSSGYLGT